MDQIVSWVATIATILAACMTASNLGWRITGIGFIVFTVGSIAWFTLGLLTDQPALVWTNAAMTLLNLFGVWRWLGRQAKVAHGGERAASSSRQMPGDTLFPASLLSRAKLVGADGKDLGTLVDAMVGCRSGQLSYLVVSEGGVAGVGEQLRRVDWNIARIDGEKTKVDLDAAGFARLPELAKDNWPGR
jgi:sporulation protein YlmC with PRC-barrel domain